MSTTDETAPGRREVVGILPDRRTFQSGVDALLKAGYSRSDLSVLASHDSLDAVTLVGRNWRDTLVALVGEMTYEGPLVTAGLIAVAAGPVGAAIAGLIAAGVGGAAIKELLDEVSAIPNSHEFEKALASGNVVLWVAVRNEAEEEKAKAVLVTAGANDIHVFQRHQGQSP